MRSEKKKVRVGLTFEVFFGPRRFNYLKIELLKLRGFGKPQRLDVTFEVLHHEWYWLKSLVIPLLTIVLGWLNGRKIINQPPMEILRGNG